MTECDYLFVYGTLRREDKNSVLARRLKETCKYIGQGKFRGKLVSLGWYPGLIESSSPIASVVGDVYQIADNPRLLEELDAYEGCGENDPKPHEFVRTVRKVRVRSRVFRSYVYLYNWELHTVSRIRHGDFIRYRRAQA